MMSGMVIAMLVGSVLGVPIGLNLADGKPGVAVVFAVLLMMLLGIVAFYGEA